MHLVRKHSDHHLVLIKNKNNAPQQRYSPRFYVESVWLQRAYFKDLVHDIWKEHSED